MQMVTYTRVAGKDLKQMDEGLIFMLMEDSLQEHGLMIDKMDMARNFGQMEANMKVIMRLEKGMEKVNCGIY